MLKISVKLPDGEQDTIWFIGNSRRGGQTVPLQIDGKTVDYWFHGLADKVQRIFITGSEATIVRKYADNIPSHAGTQLTYMGETAQWIVANWDAMLGVAYQAQHLLGLEIEEAMIRNSSSQRSAT
ncbi:MAG: hypothetical protein WCY09_08160 [Candidatus Omnitrophota bacterium]